MALPVGKPREQSELILKHIIDKTLLEEISLNGVNY